MDEHSRNHEEDRRHYSDDHNREGGEGGEEENKPIRVVCIFGLHASTTPKKIEDAFSKYGPLEKVNLIWDKERDRSKGYAFVYFDSVESAQNAKNESEHLELDGQKIRIDFSKSEAAHRPTPGLYLGKDYNRYHSHRGGDRGGSYYRGGDRRPYDRPYDGRPRSRSPPPRSYDHRPPPRSYDRPFREERPYDRPYREDPYYRRSRSPPRGRYEGGGRDRSPPRHRYEGGYDRRRSPPPFDRRRF